MGIITSGFGLLFVIALIYGLVAMCFHLKSYLNKDTIKADQSIPNLPAAYEGRTGSQLVSVIASIILLLCASGVGLALLVPEIGAGFMPPSLLGALVTTPVLLGVNAPIIWNKKYVRAELFALGAKKPAVVFQKTVSWITWILGELIGWGLLIAIWFSIEQTSNLISSTAI